ncbi:MarR family winged helix-turn-helix transcriptional regulator [Roseomonas sp. BN140053]|uniref:MarR family winged helix-turn-helix transcriptional regulator n=1 Tax=Roseomonas sp. BN140053 TaxID=3391898 RepID=UPI0039EB4E11
MLPEPPELAPPACNCLALRQAARQVTQIYDRHLAPTGLRATQFSVLARLGRVGPAPISALAAGLAMDRTTLGRALRPLSRDGLLRIGPGRDGRTRALHLTEAGRARLDAAAPLWRAAQAEFEAGFGTAEAAALREALGRAAVAAASTPEPAPAFS